MSRTDEIEQQAREHRWAQSAKLQNWATELKALADQMWNEDSKNGWLIRYIAEPELHALVTIGGKEFARFSRDEIGLIGVFGGTGQPQRYATRQAAFDDAVKRRMVRPKAG